MVQGAFALRGHKAHLFAATQCLRNEGASCGQSDLRKKRLKLVCDAGEVRSNRLQVDVVAHVDSLETECIRSWVNGEVVRVTEGDMGLKG